MRALRDRLARKRSGVRRRSRRASRPAASIAIACWRARLARSSRSQRRLDQRLAAEMNRRLHPLDHRRRRRAALDLEPQRVQPLDLAQRRADDRARRRAGAMRLGRIRFSTSAMRPANAASTTPSSAERGGIRHHRHHVIELDRAAGRAHKASSLRSSLREARRSPPSSGMSAARASGAIVRRLRASPRRSAGRCRARHRHSRGSRPRPWRARTRCAARALRLQIAGLDHDAAIGRAAPPARPRPPARYCGCRRAPGSRGGRRTAGRCWPRRLSRAGSAASSSPSSRTSENGSVGSSTEARTIASTRSLHQAGIGAEHQHDRARRIGPCDEAIRFRAVLSATTARLRVAGDEDTMRAACGCCSAITLAARSSASRRARRRGEALLLARIVGRHAREGAAADHGLAGRELDQREARVDAGDLRCHAAGVDVGDDRVAVGGHARPSGDGSARSGRRRRSARNRSGSAARPRCATPACPCGGHWVELDLRQRGAEPACRRSRERDA